MGGASTWYDRSVILKQSPIAVSSPDGRLAGYLLLCCALLSIAVVSHHPTIHTHVASNLLHDVVALSAADMVVHGFLIAFMFALTYGMVIFSLRQGPRLTSIGGLLFYIAGSGAVLIALLIDGFFVPAFASANVHSPESTLSGVLAVLGGSGVFIQVLTKFGFACFSSAIATWSLGLLRSSQRIGYLAIAGVMSATLPIGLIALGPRSLTPATLAMMLLSQAAWYVVVGVLMIKTKL